MAHLAKTADVHLKRMGRRFYGLKRVLRKGRTTNTTTPIGAHSGNDSSRTAISDLLWEQIHAAGGATGRNNNARFVELFIRLCGLMGAAAAFEIGAHEAAFSQELKRRNPGTEIFAFEANPHVFAQYKACMPPGLTYLNQAIGADCEPKQLFIPKVVINPDGVLRLPPNNRTGSLHVRSSSKGAEYETVTCDCRTVDAWHAQLNWPNSVLWIDVEGALDAVLTGAVRSLERSIQCVMLEVERRPHWAGQWLDQDVVAFLVRHDFEVLARDAETSWQYNRIFVRRKHLTRPVINLVKEYVEDILTQGLQ